LKHATLFEHVPSPENRPPRSSVYRLAMSCKTILPLLLMLFTGCQQARSFLHMNSDSPAPFLGFELAVDASDVQQRQLRQDRSRTLPTTTMPTSTTAVSNFLASDPDSSAKKSSQSETSRPNGATADTQTAFVATSDSGPQNGTLKYSLPSVDLLNGGVEAEEVDAIIDRFPG
jgi:hypothetical protein